MPEPKNRSRILLLSHICQFSLTRRYGDQVYGGLKDMAFRENRSPRIGSLVSLSSAPASKWYLSWVAGVSGDTYTLESIEDGELCNWSNVGIYEYDRSQIDNHPEWRWADKQHGFKDRWWRACYKTRDAYVYRPIYPTFYEDGSVEIGVRVIHGIDPRVIRKTFPNWKKVRASDMLEFYDAAVAELEIKPNVEN